MIAAAGAAESAESGVVAEREQPIQELFLSEVVYPQEAGELQFSLGSRHEWDSGGGHELRAAVEFGLTDIWQLAVEWDGILVAGSPDLGERAVELSTQLSFLGVGGTGIDVAAGLELELPTGAGAGADRESAGLAPYLVVAHELAGLGGVHVFGQLVRAHGEPAEDDGALVAEEGPRMQAHFGLYLPLERVVLTAELVDRGDDGTCLGPGVVWQPAPGFELGVGAAFELSDVAAGHVMLSLTHEF